LKSKLNSEKLIVKLRSDLELLRRDAADLDICAKECGRIGIKTGYTPEELKSFETFITKIARVSDIFVQNIIKTVVSMTHKDGSASAEGVGIAEELGMITSADELVQMTDLRTAVSRGQISGNQSTLYEKALKFAPKLRCEIETMEHFLTERGLI
jgi:hypothetical protein